MHASVDRNEPGWLKARLNRQLSELVRLSVPTVLQRLGIMTMGVVDVMMVGHYASTELAYQTAASIPVVTVLVISIGLMMGTMVLTSNAYGEENYEKCGQIWRQSMFYSLVIGGIGTLICLIGEPILVLLDQAPDVAAGGGRVMQILAFSIVMNTVMLSSQFFLEGISRPLPGMIFMAVANIVNIFLNWVLVYGNLGFDPMAAEGSAWATTIIRTLLAGGIFLYVWNLKDREKFGIGKPVDLRWKSWSKLREVGYGVGVTNAVEHTGFAALQVFAGWIGPLALGAMAICFNFYGLPFMMAVGIGGATAVRVGIAYGRRDPHDMMLAGICGSVLNILIIVPMMWFFYFMPAEIAGLFTDEQPLINETVIVIQLASFFLLLDTTQTVLGNALRGRQDIWVPTIIYLLAFLVLMVPLAYYLTFSQDRGLEGMMQSVVIASLLACVFLVMRFMVVSIRDIRRYGRE